jgi:hypothetical protein
MPAEQLSHAERISDSARVKGRTRHLGQQRLKEVMVAAVDEGQAHWGTLHRAGRSQPAEPAPDNHHVG